MSILAPNAVPARSLPGLAWNTPMFWLSLCSAAIALTTLTFDNDIGPTMLGMDSVALLKFGVRLFSIVVLSRVCWLAPADRQRQIALWAMAPLFVFIFWALATCLWSPLRTVSAGQAVSFTSLVMLGVTAAVICRTREDFLTWLVVLFWIISAAGVLILTCHFVVPGMRIVRTSQGLMHPTNAAATGCLGFLLAVGLWCLGEGRMQLRLLVASMAVHAMVLIMAVNRGSVFALFVAIVPLFALIGNRTMLAIAGVVLAIAAVGYIVADPGFRTIEDATANALEFGSRGQSSKQLAKLSGRQILWKKVLSLHNEAPWVGHGYFVTSPTGSINVWNTKGNRTAHNFALQILASTGRIGLALLAIGLFIPIRLIVRQLYFDRNDWRLLAFSAGVLLWFTVWGLASESIAGPTTPEGVVFFVVLGCGVGLAASRKSEGETRVDSDAVVGGNA